MAFPSEGYSLGDTDEARHEARSTWAAVAHAVAEFEPVTIVVDPNERAVADRYLSKRDRDHRGALNDAWMRDIRADVRSHRRRVGRRGGLGVQRLGSAGLGAVGP